MTIEPICKVKIISDNGAISREKLDELSAKVHQYPKGKMLLGYSIRESDQNDQYVRVSDINSPAEWIKCWDSDGKNPRVHIAGLELKSDKSQLDQVVALFVAALRESNNPSLPSKEPLMLDPSDKLFSELESIKTRLGGLDTKFDRMSDTQKKDHEMLTEHDKILIRGTDTSRPIQETIRAMDERQRIFFESLSAEKVEAKKEAAEKQKKKDEDRTKLKWTIFTLALTILPPFIWNGIVFWITVALPSIGKTP